MIQIRTWTSPGEVRVAALRGGTLLDYSIWRPGAPDGIGDIHRGRVVAKVPAMAGAFVSLGGADGFLPDSEGARDITEGTIVPVRVTRSAQGGKGPRLTGKIAPPPPAGPAGLVRRGEGPLLELAGRYPDAPVMVDDMRLAAELRAPLGERVRIAAPVSEDAAAAAIDALEQPIVALPGGGRLAIYPTPALVAIDVDGGGAVAARRSAADHHAALNGRIIPAIAAQIRLRNLSGAIVVDLAGMTIRKRAALAPAFIQALADDPLGPKFLGFTALGLAEILRPRTRPPLHELLAGPHAAGLAALRQIARNLGQNPRAMPTLRASPAIVEALGRDPVALADLASRAGRALMLRSDPSMPEIGWILDQDHV
jgi:Ribonuclease G/E